MSDGNVPAAPDRTTTGEVACSGAVPQDRAERARLKRLAEAFAEANAARLVPPLVLDELRVAADELVRTAGIDARFTDFVAVLLNNEVWKDHVAGVPFDRRLLLLPKCLRHADSCVAPIDEFGLSCLGCGLCPITDVQSEAQRLGYAVLVAEGADVVNTLIQAGRIGAIVGVGCLSVLEQAFPYMEAAAIPGLAIPLLRDGCRDTDVDVDWVRDGIHSIGIDRTVRLDLDQLRSDVQSWFAPDALDALLGGAPENDTEAIARAWLARGGKRWRPFLTVCVWKALQDDPRAEIPEPLKRLAVGVECFHKASLAHDDIEDGDEERYGEPSLHAEHGVPVALNCGDLLIGEGYRLIADCGAPADRIATMLGIASRCHRALCLGQGAELTWTRAPRPMAPAEVLEVFRLKTAPAFEVALQLGAALAGADEPLMALLARFSDALGVAYQIRDDLDDLDVREVRPSLPLAVAYEQATGADRELLARVWARRSDTSVARLAALGETTSREMLDTYRDNALRSLVELANPSLKGLLRRVAGKIFHVEVRGWCGELETRHAADRATVPQPAA